MRRSSIYISAVVHLLLIVLAIMGLPFLTSRDIVVPQPITVDLVQITKITQTKQVAPPAPPKPEPPKPEPPKPVPAPPTPAPPAPPEKDPPKPEEKIVKPTPAVDENAPPKKDKKPVKKEEPKKPQPQKDFASVLKQLDLSNKQAPPTQPAQQAPLGEKMSMSEEDALRAQLEQCWDVPIGAKDVENMVVQIFMVINPDRTLREARVVDTSRYNSDGIFQAVADSAVRAVQRCSPFNLPPDKYDTWKTTTVTFNPKDMF